MFDQLNWPAFGSAPDALLLFICYAWHSQFIAWSLYSCSVYNNVLIAAERMIAIVFPFHVKRLSQIRFRVVLFFGELIYSILIDF